MFFLLILLISFMFFHADGYRRDFRKMMGVRIRSNATHEGWTSGKRGGGIPSRRSIRGNSGGASRSFTRGSTRGSTRRSIRGSTRGYSGGASRSFTRGSTRGSTRRNIRGSTRGNSGGSRVRANDEFDTSYNVRTYECPAGSVGHSYKLLPINDDRWYWFEEAFTPEKGAKLGVGFDVKEKRDPYDAMNVRGVWRVRGGDRSRFEAGIDKGWKNCRRHGATNRCKLETKQMNTELQKIRGIDKLIPPHPTNSALNQTLTLFLHGTGPDVVPLIACNGMKASAKGLFGTAIYLSDKVAKIDQYVKDDCTSLWGQDCKYIIDTTKTVDGQKGFPPQPGAWFDRKKPMFYAFVILTSPFRIAKEYPIRKQRGKGRKDERNLFFTKKGSGQGKWKDWPFNFTTQSFDLPRRGGALFDNFEFAHAFSKQKHGLVAKKNTWKGWKPILDRYDEYYSREPEYMTAEYVVAYQRDCQYTC